jgi:hypothetical protein
VKPNVTLRISGILLTQTTAPCVPGSLSRDRHGFGHVAADEPIWSRDNPVQTSVAGRQAHRHEGSPGTARLHRGQQASTPLTPGVLFPRVSTYLYSAQPSPVLFCPDPGISASSRRRRTSAGDLIMDPPSRPSNPARRGASRGFGCDVIFPTRRSCRVTFARCPPPHDASTSVRDSAAANEPGAGCAGADLSA